MIGGRPHLNRWRILSRGDYQLFGAYVPCRSLALWGSAEGGRFLALPNSAPPRISGDPPDDSAEGVVLSEIGRLLEKEMAGSGECFDLSMMSCPVVPDASDPVLHYLVSDMFYNFLESRVEVWGRRLCRTCL